jgi:hypothetical protein
VRVHTLLRESQEHKPYFCPDIHRELQASTPTKALLCLRKKSLLILVSLTGGDGQLLNPEVKRDLRMLSKLFPAPMPLPSKLPIGNPMVIPYQLFQN